MLAVVDAIHILLVHRLVIHRGVDETVDVLFVLQQVHLPVQVHVVDVVGDDVFQAHSAQVEIQHVIVVIDGIDEFKIPVFIACGVKEWK